MRDEWRCHDNSPTRLEVQPVQPDASITSGRLKTLQRRAALQHSSVMVITGAAGWREGESTLPYTIWRLPYNALNPQAPTA